MSQHLNHGCKQSSAFERLSSHLICPRPSNAKQIKLADARPKQWTSRHWNLSSACLKQMERIHRSHPCKQNQIAKHRLLEINLEFPCVASPVPELTFCGNEGLSAGSSGWQLEQLRYYLMLLLTCKTEVGCLLPSYFSAKQCLDRDRDRANSQVNVVVKKSLGNTFNKRA